MATARRLKVAMILVALTGVSGVTAAVAHDGGTSRFETRLIGYQEVPAVSSAGGGTFRAAIDQSGTQVRWQLTYSGLNAPAQQAHIHFGQRAVTGGISVFLCTNLGNGPAGTQACPAAGGTVSGTFTAADVIGPAGQGIAPGEFAELIRAMRSGVTYANVHSVTQPGGEIRGQLGDDDDEDED